MSGPAPTKRLVYLQQQVFRYIKNSAKPKYGPGPHFQMIWASCAMKPSKPINFQVTNPGTSFARVEVQKAVFLKPPAFPKPCGLTNNEE